MITTKPQLNTQSKKNLANDTDTIPNIIMYIYAELYKLIIYYCECGSLFTKKILKYFIIIIIMLTTCGNI